MSRSRVSSVSIVSDYRLDDRAIGVWSPAGAKDFSSVPRPALGPTQPPVQWVPGVLSPGIKARPRRDADHSPHLVPRSWMSRSYTSSAPVTQYVCCWTALLLPLPSICSFQRMSKTWFINQIFKPSVVSRHTRIRVYKTLARPELVLWKRSMDSKKNWWEEINISRNVFPEEDCRIHPLGPQTEWRHFNRITNVADNIIHISVYEKIGKSLLTGWALTGSQKWF
jgi:hypothetical protein